MTGRPGRRQRRCGRQERSANAAAQPAAAPPASAVTSSPPSYTVKRAKRPSAFVELAETNSCVAVMSAPAAAVTGSASTLLSTHAAASATLPLTPATPPTPALPPTYHHQIKPKKVHFQTRTCLICDEIQYKNWYRQFSYHFQKDNVHCSNCYLNRYTKRDEAPYTKFTL